MSGEPQRSSLERSRVGYGEFHYNALLQAAGSFISKGSVLTRWSRVAYQKAMALFRIIIHGFALSAANIISIIVAFGVYKILKTPHQLFILVPVAVILSIGIFLIWILLTRLTPFKFIFIKTLREFSWVFLTSLAWGPIIFIPLHHTTQGYLTGSGNIIALFQFQLPVNVLVILVAKRIIRTVSK